MINDKQILCVIPIITNSLKKIDEQSVYMQQIDGSPLIQKAIQDALQSQYIDYILVVSDGSQYWKSIVQVYKAEFDGKIGFLNAKAKSGTKVQIQHIASYSRKIFQDMQSKADYVVTLNPLNCNRNAQTIDKCISKMHQSMSDSLFTAVKINGNVWQKTDDQAIALGGATKQFDMVQQNSVVYISDWDCLANGKLIGNNPTIFIISKEQSRLLVAQSV